MMMLHSVKKSKNKSVSISKCKHVNSRSETFKYVKTKSSTRKSDKLYPIVKFLISMSRTRGNLNRKCNSISRIKW